MSSNQPKNLRLGTYDYPSLRLVVWSFAVCMLVAGISTAAPGATGAYTNNILDDGSKYDIFAAEQIVYDTNLYRLPGNSTDLGIALAPKQSRSDYIDTLSAGSDALWIVGLQNILLDLRADDNRFARNDDLNYVSGIGKLIGNWRIGNQLSGDAGADYSRTLAGFAATGYLGRDLIDRYDFFGDGRYQIGPRWAVFGGGTLTHVSNSALAELINDIKTNAGNAGVEYATSVDNAIGGEYRYSSGHYTQSAALLNGVMFDRDYQDDSERGYLKYSLSDKTSLNASVGYLKRRYPNTTIGGFSGDVWNASVTWQMTDKSKLAAEVSRDLLANLDAESNYFVSQGGTITPTWIASDRITLTSTIAWYKQNYISSSPSAILVGSRRDTSSFQQLSLQYTASRFLSFAVSYRHEERESNDPVFRYNDDLITGIVTFKVQ